MPDRIYGDFQWAGFKIPTTAKSQVSSDGTNAYAPGVVLVDTSGNPTGGTGTSAQQVQGNLAPSTTDAGTNPVKIGGVYNLTPPTYTTGVRTDIQTDNNGNVRIRLAAGTANAPDGQSNTCAFVNDANSTSTRLLGVANYGSDGATWNRIRADTNGSVSQSALVTAQWNYAGVTGGITTTTDATVSAANVTLRNYMRSVQFLNTSATASEIVVKDGATTVVWRGMAPASMTQSTTIVFDPPLKGSVNTAMNVAMITTGTATRVSAQGWQGV